MPPHAHPHRLNAPPPGRNIFYLVPSGTQSTTSDNIGTFLRLGEYSDVEKRVFDHGHQSDLYPAKHVSDEGNDSSVYTNAAGGSQGILMSCDGRLLIKTAEKMYVESGDYHQKTSNYDLDVDGNMNATVQNNFNLTTEKGDMTVTSASKLKVECNAEERKIKGKSTHTYDKWHLIKYKDSYESHKYGWDFQSIYGFNMTSYYGGIMESVYGVRMQFDKFNFFSDWVCFNWKGVQIDLKTIVMKKVTAKFGSTDCKAELNEIMVGLEGLKVENSTMKGMCGNLQVQTVTAELKNSGCDVKLGNLTCYV
ncbi:hypothetical protein [Roseibium sp. M-1]